MTTKYQEFPDLQTVEITVNGRVTKKDFDKIAPKMEKFIEEHGTIKILEVIDDFSGFDLSVITDGIRFDLKHLKNFSHCALVCNDGWMGPFTRTLAPFFSIDIRTFKMDQLDEARAWLATV